MNLLKDWFVQLALGAAMLVVGQSVSHPLAGGLLSLAGACVMCVGAVRGLFRRAQEQKALSARTDQKPE
jgi:hypothetical protein